MIHKLSHLSSRTRLEPTLGISAILTECCDFVAAIVEGVGVIAVLRQIVGRIIV